MCDREPSEEIARAASFRLYRTVKGEETSLHLEDSKTPALLFSLNPGTWYAIRVYALNSEGNSPPSSTCAPLSEVPRYQMQTCNIATCMHVHMYMCMLFNTSYCTVFGAVLMFPRGSLYGTYMLKFQAEHRHRENFTLRINIEYVVIMVTGSAGFGCTRPLQQLAAHGTCTAVLYKYASQLCMQEIVTYPACVIFLSFLCVALIFVQHLYIRFSCGATCNCT
eukprot:jgi/Botrbrau1/14493/Bobra.0014s0127.1